jgi:hypothetical protein|nr:MAG TPA: Mediator of RNA polymerase II initiation, TRANSCRIPTION, macromolecular complex [Caudoviricetes sp.]
MTDRIKELQNLVNEQLENMAICEKEKDRKFFYDEYLRLKKIMDKEMDEFASGLANFNII